MIYVLCLEIPYFSLVFQVPLHNMQGFWKKIPTSGLRQVDLVGQVTDNSHSLTQYSVHVVKGLDSQFADEKNY